MEEEPLILAFCCHYCAYAAADMAGSMRLQYPGNVRVLRLPCTGKTEVNYILAAFERGVDGVMGRVLASSGVTRESLPRLEVVVRVGDAVGPDREQLIAVGLGESAALLGGQAPGLRVEGVASRRRRRHREKGDKGAF